MKPVLLVIAGPNGSGKTTVTVTLRRDKWSQDVEYINPDDIAKEKFGDWNSLEAVLNAANWAEARRKELIKQKAGIAFETVFSAQDKVDFLQSAKDQGYFLRVFFVGTSNPEINAARVAKRIIKGGHGVPLEKIISRYEKSMVNLMAAMLIADRVYIYDNSVDEQDALLCVRIQDQKIRKIYAALPEWVSSSIKPLEYHPEFEDLRS
jgi:predicted ABC-type ATPase